MQVYIVWFLFYYNSYNILIYYDEYNSFKSKWEQVFGTGPEYPEFGKTEDGQWGIKDGADTVTPFSKSGKFTHIEDTATIIIPKGIKTVLMIQAFAYDDSTYGSTFSGTGFISVIDSKYVYNRLVNHFASSLWIRELEVQEGDITLTFTGGRGNIRFNYTWLYYN